MQGDRHRRRQQPKHPPVGRAKGLLARTHAHHQRPDRLAAVL